MLMIAKTFLSETLQEAFARTQPSSRFEYFAGLPIAVCMDHAVLAHVSHSREYSPFFNQFAHTLLGPAGCRSWMFMQKVSPICHLEPIDLSTKVEVDLSLN